MVDSSCPSCGKKITNVTGVRAGTTNLGPVDNPDEIQICANCGTPLKVQQKNPLLYRTLSQRETDSLDPMDREMIRRARELIRNKRSSTTLSLF